jgi:hypothetical protein
MADVREMRIFSAE